MSSSSSILVSVGFTALILGFTIGRYSKVCEVCKPCITPKVQVEIVKKELEIKRLKDEIIHINIDANKRYRDSIRTIYNPR